MSRAKRSLIILLSVTAVVLLLLRATVAYPTESLCYSTLDYFSTTTIFLQIFMVLRWVSTNCRELEQMQRDELLVVMARSAAFRVNSMLSLNLEFLWDRISRFQVFLYSVFFSILVWLMKTVIYSLFERTYTEFGACEVIFGLVVNRNQPHSKEDPLTLWIWLSVLGEILMSLLTFTFPTVFIYTIIECSLIKKR